MDGRLNELVHSAEDTERILIFQYRKIRSPVSGMRELHFHPISHHGEKKKHLSTDDGEGADASDFEGGTSLPGAGKIAH